MFKKLGIFSLIAGLLVGSQVLAQAPLNPVIPNPTAPAASGSWTPVPAGSTSGGWTVNSAITGGGFNSFPGMTIARFSITTTAANSPVGNIVINGLPATEAQPTQGFGGPCVFTVQTGLTNTASFTGFTGFVGTLSNTITLFEIGSGQTGQAAAVARAAAVWRLDGVCFIATQ